MQYLKRHAVCSSISSLFHITIWSKERITNNDAILSIRTGCQGKGTNLFLCTLMRFSGGFYPCLFRSNWSNYWSNWATGMIQNCSLFFRLNEMRAPCFEWFGKKNAFYFFPYTHSVIKGLALAAKSWST